MKRISYLMILMFSILIAASAFWAQEEGDSEYEDECVRACYDIEEDCFAACESAEDVDACDVECQEATAACVEQCK